MDCRVIERISKTGQPYKCLVIKLVDGYEKIVYLTTAEQALLNSKPNK